MSAIVKKRAKISKIESEFSKNAGEVDEIDVDNIDIDDDDPELVKAEKQISKIIDEIDIQLKDSSATDIVQLNGREISEETFNALFGINEELESDGELINDQSFQTKRESKFFVLSHEISNIMDPKNYVMIKQKDRQGRITKKIISRSTAQNISRFIQETIGSYNLQNQIWMSQNKEEIERVEKEF